MRLFNDTARSGRNASGLAAASRRCSDGLLDRGGQRLLPPPQLGLPAVEPLLNERGQIGPERVRTGLGQPPT